MFLLLYQFLTLYHLLYHQRFALRRFSPGTPVFPSPQKPTLPNSNSIWKAQTRLNGFIGTLKCFVGKKAIYIFFKLFADDRVKGCHYDFKLPGKYNK